MVLDLIAISVQMVGTLLVAALLWQLTRVIAGRFLRYWSAGWVALTVALFALRVPSTPKGPRVARPAGWSSTAAADTASGILVWAGFRNFATGAGLRRTTCSSSPRCSGSHWPSRPCSQPHPLLPVPRPASGRVLPPGVRRDAPKYRPAPGRRRLGVYVVEVCCCCWRPVPALRAGLVLGRSVFGFGRPTPRCTCSSARCSTPSPNPGWRSAW